MDTEQVHRNSRQHRESNRHRESILSAVAQAGGLPAACAIMLVLCFPPYSYAWLAWIALVPLALTFRLRRYVWLVYGSMYVAGVGFHLAVADWMRTRDGSQGFDSPVSKGWIAAGCLVGASWLMTLLLGRTLSQRTRWPLAVILPIAWVGHEYARRVVTALIDEVGFPWGGLATTQCGHIEWIQVADLAGGYAIAGLIALVGGMLADVVNHLPGLLTGRGMARQFVFASTMFAAVGLFGAYGYGMWRLAQANTAAGPTVALMPSRHVFEFLTTSNDATGTSDSGEGDDESRIAEWTNGVQDADVLLWSETVLSGFVVGQDSASAKHSALVRRMERRAKELDAALVVGCNRQDEQGRYLKLCNSTVVVDAHHGYRGFYDKVCLVPWREFTPWIGYELGIRSSSELTRGELFPVFPLATSRREEPYRVATAICYDIAFSGVMRAFRRGGSAGRAPEFFVFSSCEYTDTTGCLQESLLRMAQLRAVECRRSIVRNVDGGYRALIDGNGRVLRSSDRSILDAPWLVGPVPIDRRASLYAAWGDWLPITALVVVLGVVLTRRRRLRKGLARSKRFKRTPAHAEAFLEGARE